MVLSSRNLKRKNISKDDIYPEVELFLLPDLDFKGGSMSKFRVRDKEIKIMCTAAEKEQIEQNARDSGMDMSRYLRTMGLEGYIIDIDFTELKNLIYEVNKIGNNINQIAYHVNRDHIVYRSDIEEVKVQINTLWSLLRAKLFSFK